MKQATRTLLVAHTMRSTSLYLTHTYTQTWMQCSPHSTRARFQTNDACTGVQLYASGEASRHTPPRDLGTPHTLLASALMEIDEEHYDTSPCPTLFVLDGANIAYAGGACVGGGSTADTRSKQASVAAILAALEFFHSRRFTNTVVFLPAYWLHRKPGATGGSVSLPVHDKAVLEVRYP